MTKMDHRQCNVHYGFGSDENFNMKITWSSVNFWYIQLRWPKSVTLQVCLDWYQAQYVSKNWIWSENWSHLFVCFPIFDSLFCWLEYLKNVMQRGALKIVCYLNWKVLLFNVHLSEPKDEIRKWPSRLDELERESSPTNWHRAYKIALAINCICHFLVLPQTTSVLRVYNVYSTWVVWSENRAKIIASAKVLCSSL